MNMLYLKNFTGRLAAMESQNIDGYGYVLFDNIFANLNNNHSENDDIDSNQCAQNYSENNNTESEDYAKESIKNTKEQPIYQNIIDEITTNDLSQQQQDDGVVEYLCNMFKPEIDDENTQASQQYNATDDCAENNNTARYIGDVYIDENEDDEIENLIDCENTAPDKSDVN
jgi:hypothetical protein